MAALVLYVTLAFRSYRWRHDISTSYSYCTEFISFSHHPGKRLHTHAANTLHTSTPHSLYQELINLWSIFSNQLTLSPWQPPFSPPSSAIHYTKLLRPVCVCELVWVIATIREERGSCCLQTMLAESQHPIQQLFPLRPSQTQVYCSDMKLEALNTHAWTIQVMDFNTNALLVC